jgi:hypothetical protein
MSGDNTDMSSSNDSTVEEDVIDEAQASASPKHAVASTGVQQTTTDFARISFLVDEETTDEPAFMDQDEPTDSFNDIDNTEDNTQSEGDADFDESCNTLEVQSDD